MAKILVKCKMWPWNRQFFARKELGEVSSNFETLPLGRRRGGGVGQGCQVLQTLNKANFEYRHNKPKCTQEPSIHSWPKLLHTIKIANLATLVANLFSFFLLAISMWEKKKKREPC